MILSFNKGFILQRRFFFSTHLQVLLDLLVKGCSPGIELEVRRLTSLNSVFWASVTWRVLLLANLKESPSRKVWHKDWIWGQVDQGVATRCAESVNNMSYRMINCSQAGFGEVINDKWYMHALWLANSWYIRHRLNLAYVANSWYEALVETLYGKLTIYGRNLAYMTPFGILHMTHGVSGTWQTSYLAYIAGSRPDFQSMNTDLPSYTLSTWHAGRLRLAGRT